MSVSTGMPCIRSVLTARRGASIRSASPSKPNGSPSVSPTGAGVYHLPNGSGGWLLTAPIVANEWFSTRNSTLSHHLAPIVRLLKSWNRAHSKRMRSFHLETVAATMFSSLGSNHRDGLQKFFEWAPSYLHVNAPGGQGGDLSSYLSRSARQDLLTSLSSAAGRAKKANEAEARGDHAEAKKQWRIILGDSFPTG
ncbi:hypothetical protein [Microbacterium maritypicum]